MFNGISEIVFLHAWALTTTAKLSARAPTRERDERGIGVAEAVILTAVFAAAALAIGAIIVKKFTDKAQSIPTG